VPREGAPARRHGCVLRDYPLARATGCAACSFNKTQVCGRCSSKLLAESRCLVSMWETCLNPAGSIMHGMRQRWAEGRRPAFSLGVLTDAMGRMKAPHETTFFGVSAAALSAAGSVCVPSTAEQCGTQHPLASWRNSSSSPADPKAVPFERSFLLVRGLCVQVTDPSAKVN